MKNQNQFNNMNSINNQNNMNLNKDNNINNNFQNFQNNQFGNNILQNKDKEILDLKNELSKAKITIEQQKFTIINLQNQLNNNNGNIQFYQNIINQKELEINKLKLELQNINPQNKGEYVNKNKIMTVNFISVDQQVHFAVSCIDTDTFAEVEEKLYKKFPEYRETNNNFIANGEPVLRFKTISENKIGNGLPVTMVIP